jgi:hypothetical protein
MPVHIFETAGSFCRNGCGEFFRAGCGGDVRCLRCGWSGWRQGRTTASLEAGFVVCSVVELMFLDGMSNGFSIGGRAELTPLTLAVERVYWKEKRSVDGDSDMADGIVILDLKCAGVGRVL